MSSLPSTQQEWTFGEQTLFLVIASCILLPLVILTAVPALYFFLVDTIGDEEILAVVASLFVLLMIVSMFVQTITMPY